MQEHTPDDSAFSSRALTSVLSSSSGGHTHSSGPTSNAASGPQHMLETWIICELANAGNLQDAVLHHNEGAFFYQNMPHMVRRGSCAAAAGGVMTAVITSFDFDWRVVVRGCCSSV